MKKSIGILYICTGPYVLFWKDFYESFEKNFLPNTDKYYFVFTDAKIIYAEKESNVFKIFTEPQPWPIPTLLKYHMCLKYEDELKKMDYVYQSNANIICKSIVTEDEFLPMDESKPLFFNLHPGYMLESKIKYPYERRKTSLAYVPYNHGKQYVFGAMNGGRSEAYIEMMKEIEKNIEEDLKNNIIAKWHDESHVNKYVVQHNNYVILSPSYCYPVGLEVPFEKKIVGVSKEDKFDVKSFKGQYDKNYSSLRTFLGKMKRYLSLKERILWFRDTILQKSIEEL